MSSKTPLHGWDVISTINLIANYAGRLWSMFAAFIFVPIYLKILGPESFGLIAFSTTLTLMASVLNSGLIPAFARLLARDGVSNFTFQTLRSLELILIAIACGVVLITYFSSSFIAASWISAVDLEITSIALSVKIMGAICAIELLLPLYIGGFMGLEQHVKANFYQFLFGFSRSALVIPILNLYPSIVLFFAWYLFVTFAAVYLIRAAFYAKFAGFVAERYSGSHVRAIWQFASGMALVSVLSAVNSQVDKLLVSMLFNLREFAQYSVVSMLAQLPLVVSTPIAMTVLPRVTKVVKEGGAIVSLFTSYSFFVCAVACVISATTIIFPTEILSLWTADQTLSQGQESLVRILVLANLALALQLIPFQVAIAHAFTRINVLLSVICAVVAPLAIVFFIRKYGLPGAGIPWLGLNVFSAVILSFVISVRYLDTPLINLFRFVLAPLFFCGALAVIYS